MNLINDANTKKEDDKSESPADNVSDAEEDLYDEAVAKAAAVRFLAEAEAITANVEAEEALEAEEEELAEEIASVDEELSLLYDEDLAETTTLTDGLLLKEAY